MKIRKNITISDTMLERGDAVAKARGFDDFSEMVSALVREEYERRGLAESSTLKDSPPVPTTAPVSSSPAKAVAEAKIVAAVQEEVSYRKQKRQKKASK